MLIRTASYYNKTTHIGKVFCISLSQPVNCRYDVFNEFLLPTDLYWDYRKRKITRKDFEEKYLQNLKEKKEAIKNKLDAMEDKEITICCYEKSPMKCHRKIVASFLQELGYNVEIY